MTDEGRPGERTGLPHGILQVHECLKSGAVFALLSGGSGRKGEPYASPPNFNWTSVGAVTDTA